MNMDFGANKTPVEVIKKKMHLEELTLETSILVSMVNSIKSHGKNLMN